MSKKSGSSCAITADSMFTSISFVEMPSLIFCIIVPKGSNAIRDEKTAAMFIFIGMCAMVKLIINTKTQAFHTGGGIKLFVKKRLTVLLSVWTTNGFLAPQNRCPISLKTKNCSKFLCENRQFD